MDIAWLEHIMHAIVEIAIILLEFVGLCILLLSAGKSVIRYLSWAERCFVPSLSGSGKNC